MVAFFIGNCSIAALIQLQFLTEVLMFLYWPVECLIVLNYFIFEWVKKKIMTVRLSVMLLI